jgi:hypothetical protein
MVNCRLMNGLDWRTVGMPEYQTMLAAWNLRHDPDGPKGSGDFTRLKRAMTAHSIH